MEKISERIADFLALLDECKRTYDWAYEQVGTEDLRSVDLEHAIEFADSNDQLVETAKKLHECRKKRRMYKDMTELTYIVNFWADRNQTSINYLKETLGRVRQAEENQATRIYTPRVESEESCTLETIRD